MNVISDFWNTFLLTPFFNILILTYQTIGFYSLGASIIILTILLRIVILPASLSAGKMEAKLKSLDPKLKEIDEKIKDPQRKKEELQKILDENHIDAYGSLISLLFQTFFFFLLYQTFTHGFDTKYYSLIYDFLPVPDGQISTTFMGIDLTKSNTRLSFLSSILLFILMFGSSKKFINKSAKNFSEKWYNILVPAFLFLINSFLPSAKALFFSTSFLFSLILKSISPLIFKGKNIEISE